jgi:hypothetical protein
MLPFARREIETISAPDFSAEALWNALLGVELDRMLSSEVQARVAKPFAAL